MDENKIEITVELDTSKAEKQAEDLNDALVDGAKDANKEFKKYSDSVNKNLNKIKQQVNKTFDGAKMANSLTSKVGKALNGIKSKINSILGNINIKTTVNANTSSQQGSTGSSGADAMGASLATGGLIGSQLVKALSLDKPLQQTRSFLDTIKNIAKSLKSVKIGEEQFGASFMAKTISTYKKALETTENKNYTFGKAVDHLRDRLKEVAKEFKHTETDIFYMTEMVNETLKVMERLGIEGGEVDERFAESFASMNVRVTEIVDKLKELQASDEIFIDIKEFDGLKSLVNDLMKATQGLNKFKLIAAYAMGETKKVIVGGVTAIKSKLNNSMFSPLVSGIKKVKTVISSSKLGQAFKQGFQEPQPYIDRMKAKIKEWANNHKKATDKVKKANKSVGASFKSLLQQMLPIASIYGAFNALKTSITSYADGLQQSGKFATVFGNEAEDMTDWLNKLNSTVTTSKSTLMDFSSNLYNMGKNMEMPTDKALDMTKSMTKLGADLEAFTGDANAIDALAGALRGEYDSLQNFGYIIDADAVKTRALAMGLDASAESAKALARQSIILEQSKMAGILGYSATQAQTLSGQLAMLRKNFQALGTAIGSCFAGLLQVVLPVLNSIVSAVTQAFSKLAGLINSIFGLFGVKVGSSGASGGGVVGDAVGGIVDNLGSGLDGAGSDVADNLASGAESAKEIAKGLMGIDEINTIGSPSDSGGSGSGSGSSGAGGAGTGAGSVPSLDFTTGGESITDTLTGELTEFQRAFLTVFERIKQGFILFKDDILAEWSKLKANIDALGREMAEFFTSCWRNGLDDTALIFGSFISATIATGLQMVNSVVEVVTNLFNHLNPDNNENTKKFIDAINNLLMQIVKFVRDAGDWFEQFTNACQPFINNLGDIAMIVGGILAQVLADAIQLVRDFMNSWAGQALIEGVAKALEWLSGALEACLGFIQDHITFFEALGLGILGAWGAFKLINGAITIWNGLMTIFASIGAICSGVVTVLGGAIAFLTSPVGLVVLAIGALIAIGVLLYKNWEKVQEVCKQVWDNVVQWFNDAGVDIEGILGDMWNYIKNTLNDIWNVVKTIFESVVNVVKTAWNSILKIVTTIIKSVWNVIKSTISLILTLIQTQLALIVAVFTGDWSKVKDITTKLFNAVKTQIKTILTGAWDIVKSIGAGIGNTFMSVFTGIVNIVASKVQLVYNSVSTKFNAVWKFIKGIVDKLKNAFNFKWSLPSLKLPRISVTGGEAPFGIGGKGSLPKFSIKWASDGAIFTSKTLLGVGDASKGVGNASEAILPLDRLWKEMDKQFAKQNQSLNKGNNQPVNITLKLDGREISKATFKNFEELSRLGIIDLSTLV